MEHLNGPAPAQGQIHSSRRILVVDDEIHIREILAVALARLGHGPADAACDGAEAWEALHKTNYSLVITDQKNAQGHRLGVDRTNAFRSHAAAGHSHFGDAANGGIGPQPRLRVDATLAKPFTVAELSAAIDKFLPASANAAIIDVNQMPETAPPSSAPARSPKKPPCRILVVDDDRDARQFKVDLLTPAGYQVQGANDGAAGWDALRTDDYDLVITDNQMPRMTGLGMIEYLHLSGMTAPVIMATGNLPTDEFARKPWLKPEAALQKPFTNRDLLAAIRNVLGPDDGDADREEIRLPKFF